MFLLFYIFILVLSYSKVSSWWLLNITYQQLGIDDDHESIEIFDHREAEYILQKRIAEIGELFHLFGISGRKIIHIIPRKIYHSMIVENASDIILYVPLFALLPNEYFITNSKKANLLPKIHHAELYHEISHILLGHHFTTLWISILICLCAHIYIMLYTSSWMSTIFIYYLTFSILRLFSCYQEYAADIHAMKIMGTDGQKKLAAALTDYYEWTCAIETLERATEWHGLIKPFSGPFRGLFSYIYKIIIIPHHPSLPFRIRFIENYRSVRQ